MVLNMIEKISFLFFLFISTCSFSQMKGVVHGINNEKREVLIGAKIRLLHAKIGVTTNEEGQFDLILPKELPDTMVVTAFGYNPDTTIVTKEDRFIALEINLFSDKMMDEVIVTYKKGTHSISRLKTLHVEEIGEGELRKAACCNLSESFETNASVDVNITDAVSGAKKIQMMGLDGVYTQIQLENIPYLRGLESSFGLNSIPGTWIESIQITKGTGNVVNGYESMAGLVNLELKKPSEMERFYVNGYGSIYGRAELNLNAGHILNPKWSTGWFVHGSGMFGEMDNNRDGFRDVPKGNNLAFLNRWAYQGKKMEAQFGINSYLDIKNGGQMGFEPSLNDGKYGVQLDSRHIDAFAKTGFFLKKPRTSIGIVYNAKYQEVNAQFGNRTFDGTEKRGYINAIYDGYIGTTTHAIKLGASGVYVDMQQKADSLESNRVEVVPGIFGEYTYTGSRMTAVVGARGDYHNLFGFQFSPRVHTKFLLSEYTDLRLTAGKGWRVPNFMIDNVSLLANAKTWIVPAELLPEISWNFGGSVVHEFKLFKRKGTISTDFYHTLFENQLVVDRDANFNQIIFTNLSGKSFSNSFQTELSIEPLKNFEIRMAYKYLDVKAEYAGEMQQQVMIPKHRGFVNVGYITRNKRWEFNSTLSVFGTSRLPAIGVSNLPSESEVYPMLNAQITHVFKRWDFYVGGENLTNYIQKNAIIDAANPFGNSFDATRIWGPIMGVNVYAGFRYSIKNKSKK
jgi:outer membrane receptor for ferrienterochelin and colicins